MATLNLDIFQSDLDNLNDDEITIEEFLEASLNYNTHDGTDHGSTICFELESYHDDEGGAPEVSEFEITDVLYTKTDGSGKFTLEYDVYRFYGCSDLNSNSNSEQTWGFLINPSNLTLELDTEEKRHRDTFEEF